MENIGYQPILERNLLPFIRKVSPDGHRMWQDNDPKHISNSTKKWMKDSGIEHWITSPESPVSNQSYQTLPSSTLSLVVVFEFIEFRLAICNYGCYALTSNR